MDQYRMNQILRVAKLHYELNMSQIEIAKKEHMSKSTVSRLVKQAVDMGLVKFTIMEPDHSYSDLEIEFIERFHLQKATIIPDVVGNSDILRHDVCVALAEDLHRFIQDDCIVGIDWGKTTATLADLLPTVKRQGVSCIQLNGGVSKTVFETGVFSTVKAFSDSFNAEGYLLPAPAMVDNPGIAEAIFSDSSFKRILNQARDCQVLIYSPGIIGYNSTLYQMGYFSEEEYDQLSMKAVGDVFSHYIQLDGSIADAQLDARVVSVPLQIIKRIPNKIVISVGIAKARATLGCLRGGFADYLYVDQPTAKEILKLDNEKREQ